MDKYAGPEWAHCDRCEDPAGQLVKFFDDSHEEALCFTCWKPLADGKLVKVLHWINRYGRVVYAKGALTGPFSIIHP